ncbi:hypothetical protein NIES4071_53960 [Calothrix sp. NIES-4071]|nr:hypothetical protein NIES4071_53960 [Calothrix sp. NIES-4071]BAZ59704.1 hypothetical protein NIES4105_53910 [Calothrix sp. NIES-4105]
MVIVALFVAWTIFIFLLRVIKTTVVNAVLLAAVIYFLQVGYGVTIFDVINYFTQGTRAVGR